MEVDLRKYRACQECGAREAELHAPNCPAVRPTPDQRQPCETTKDRIGDYKTRKQRPLCTGVLDYFPDALLEVAQCSWVGNEQHNPGERLHWAKEKSIGEGNEILRHLIDRGTVDSDGIRHSAKVAWRALELLQREIDAEKKTPWLTRPSCDCPKGECRGDHAHCVMTR